MRYVVYARLSGEVIRAQPRPSRALQSGSKLAHKLYYDVM